MTINLQDKEPATGPNSAKQLTIISEIRLWINAKIRLALGRVSHAASPDMILTRSSAIIAFC